MSLVTKQPIKPVVKIAKGTGQGNGTIAGGSIYTHNPFTSTFDFQIQSISCTPPVDSQGGTFTIKIVSSDATNTNANTFLSNIECGNEILFSFGKSSSNLTDVMLGIIETIEINEPAPNQMYVTLTGPDWGSNILKNRIINNGKFQRMINGTQYDNTDTSVSIYNLYNLLLTDSSWYPSQDGVTAQSQGVVVAQANFDPSLYGSTPTLVPQLLANYEKLDDKLSELDSWANLIHYIGPDKNIFVRPAQIQPTFGSWLFVDDPNDSVASNWKSGYVGLLEPGTTYKYTTENYDRRAFGIGGDQPQIDQQSTGISSSTNIDSTWIAQKFTPLQYKAYVIQIYVGKVGLPSPSLQFQLVQDNGGKPTGPVVATLSLDPNSITAQGSLSSTNGWVTFNIPAELNTPGASGGGGANPYWIVLSSVGSSGQTYAWYNDNGSTGTNATSTDGVTWTVNTNSKTYSFIYQYSTPIVTIYPGINIKSTDKELKEAVYRKTYIRDQITMQRYLTNLAALYANKKEIFSGRVYSPDNMITPFQQVLIRKTLSGVQLTGTTNYFTLSQVQYNFQGGASGATGIFYVDFQAIRFTVYP